MVADSAPVGHPRLPSGERSAPDASLHIAALNFVLLLDEMGRPKDAVPIATDYLKREDAWRGSLTTGGTMVMLRAMLHAGALSSGEFRAKRAAWRERAEPAFRGVPVPLWDLTYLGRLTTPVEADEAIA